MTFITFLALFIAAIFLFGYIVGFFMGRWWQKDKDHEREISRNRLRASAEKSRKENDR